MSENITGGMPEYNSLLAQENHLFTLARSGRLSLPQNWLEKYPVLFDKVLYPLAAILFGFAAPFLAAFLSLPLLLSDYRGSDYRRILSRPACYSGWVVSPAIFLDLVLVVVV